MVFDLGGPMAELLPEFIKRSTETDCIRSALQSEGQHLGEAGIDAEVVRVEWTCAKPIKEMPVSTTIRFYVVQHKIAAAIIEDPPGYEKRFPSGL